MIQSYNWDLQITEKNRAKRLTKKQKEQRMIEGSNDEARTKATDRYGAAVHDEILLNR